MDVTLRPARGDEAARISALALRSKGHWGYDEEFLEACREELTRTAGELDALFVDPPSIGRLLPRLEIAL